MLENSTKREGLLLGSLRKHPEKAPPDMVVNWTPDGDTIRALGVPIGNDFSEHDWWLGRYREVKARVARWPSLRRLSLTGRNMLLQSIYYGMFRFWLYSMVLPTSILKLMDEDAKQILWAHVPHLDDAIEGSASCRRWMKENVSYLPVDKGGGGIMHWPSHCEAYYATWIVRYLEPRVAPWKGIMRFYIQDDHIGDAIILSSSIDRNREKWLPTTAQYLKRCLRSFEALNLTQDTSLLDHSVQAEPLWFNHRFTIPEISPHHRIVHWSDRYDTNRILSLLNPKSQLFSIREWKWFLLNMAPEKLRNSPAFHDYEQTMLDQLETIHQSIPPEIKAAVTYTEPVDNATVHIVNEEYGADFYADVEATELGTVYHKLFLDLSRRPHRTGVELDTLPRGTVITPVEWWDDSTSNKDDDQPAREHQGEPGDPPEPPAFYTPRPAIIGPATMAFPRNVGWYLGHQPHNTAVTKLSDLTIETITKYNTSWFTKYAVPTCIKAWEPYVGPNIPFDKVFASLGTPLSDPTEERQYRKLLHRATYVRNRNKDAPDQRCRLCHASTENIFHLFQCPQTKPLWNACLHFCQDVLGCEQARRVPEAIIFGLQNVGNQKMFCTEALAFLRHAYECFYHDFANVDLQGSAFYWQLTFSRALKSFRNAVLRYGMQHRILFNTRRFTNLVDTAPQEVRERFASVIDIGEGGDFALQPALVDAVADAEHGANDLFTNGHAHQPNRHRP